MKFFEERFFDRRNWILDNIKKLDVSPIEALVLLQIDFLNQYKQEVSLDSLALKCNCSKSDIDDSINSLNRKGYMKMKTENGIDFDIDSIFEANKDIIEKNDLFTLSEKEFRRVLSQKEITTIAEWDRIYDVRRDAYGNTICGCSIDRIGYRNSEIVKENKEK